MTSGDPSPWYWVWYWVFGIGYWVGIGCQNIITKGVGCQEHYFGKLFFLTTKISDTQHLVEGRQTMTKPTHASVTDQPCSCGFLQEAADDPDSPIVYDAQLNEF